jgi:iron complex outermembrane receptor protein
MSSRKLRRPTGRAMATLCLLSMTLPVGAQEQTGMLEEVIVTAQKRSESVQKTALAVTAMAGEALAEKNILSATALLGQVPNLHIGQASNETVISIRGVSSAGITPAADASVAFHVDGVYQPRPSGASSMFFDLERVEVLRGPQGTLYGRNATAGSINVITAKPTDRLQSAAEIAVGNLSRITVQGMLNVPVIEEKLAVRGAFLSHRQAGYTRNAGNGQPKLNDADQIAGRLHVLTNPTENIRFLLSGDYYHRGGAGSNSVLIGRLNNDFRANGTAQPWLVATNTIPYVDNELFGISGELTWGLGAVDLTSLTAFRRDNADTTSDQDGTATGTQTSRFFNYNRNFSQELRLAAADPDRFKWIAGGYYTYEHNRDNLDQYTNLQRTTGVILRRPERYARSKALFGQASYELVDDLNATVGLRQSWDEKGSPVGLTQTIGTTTNSFRPDYGKWNKFTWKGGLEWQADDTTLYYANVGNGYKSGGFSSNRNYGPESLLAYEVGSKNDLLDRRLRLNLSGFYYDYKDLQVTATVPDEDGVVRTRTTNAAGSTVWGLEAELQAMLTRDLRINSSVAYLDASFDRYPGASDSLFRTVQDLSGNRLPRAPRFTGNIGFDFDMGVGEHGTLTLHGETRYQSKIFFSAFNDKAFVTNGVTVNPYAMAVQEGYTASAVRLRYKPAEGDWYAEIFADNLENNAILTAVTYGTGGETFGAFGPPRTFGVKLGIRM